LPALEKNFTREIALEMDRQPVKCTVFQAGVHDASIEGLVGLMINDFEAACRPCALYSETLAHALAMRFLLYESLSGDTQNSSAKPLPPRILCRIRDRIEAELDTELSLASLVWHSCDSPFDPPKFAACLTQSASTIRIEWTTY